MEFLDPSHSWVRHCALRELFEPLEPHAGPISDLLPSEAATPSTVDLSQHGAGVGQEVFLFHGAKIGVDKLVRMP